MIEKKFVLTQDMIATIAELKQHELCTRCTGRFFAKVGYGLTNYERGRLIAEKAGMWNIPAVCPLCKNIFEEVPKFASMVCEKLDKIEYNTFLIGTKVDDTILKYEAMLNNTICAKWYEPIKTELNREIGKLVVQKVHKQVDFTNPDVTVIVDTRFDNVVLQIKSLFIYGRYRKMKVGIPQTKWYCKKCFGKGCDYCKKKGKLYETSVEEIIALPVLKLVEGEGHYFHGMGREDIDVLMLGDGRPFVLEITKPLKRNIDLNFLKNLINSSACGIVEVDDLKFVDSAIINKIKGMKSIKTYRIRIKFEKKVSAEKLKKLVSILKKLDIAQRTPRRVMHRRADRVRMKKVHWAEIEKISGDEAVLTITVSNGTYVKELVTGDDGRTEPSISSILNTNCTVKGLEVLKIHNGDRIW